MSMDKITVIIASYRRPITLLKTMESLIDQCDEILLALNEIPPKESAGKLLFKFIRKHKDKIQVRYEDNTYGDGARYLFEKPQGWILTCDDDITYAPDYVSYMIGKAKQYGAAIITAHGVNLKPGKRNSLLLPQDRIQKYTCLGGVRDDVQVEVGGTGVMCFHSDVFWPDLSRFERKNMADLWVAVQAKAQEIPIICVRHEHGWLTYHLPQGWPTIWDQSYNGDEAEPYNIEMAAYHAGIINRYLR